MTANDVCGECDGPINLDDWAQRTQNMLVNVSKTLTNVVGIACGLGVLKCASMST